MTERIKGLVELQRVLDQLPVKLEQNVMVGGMRAAAKVMRQAARALAPVGPPSSYNLQKYGGRPGLLRDSITARTGVKWGTVTAKITAGGPVKGGGNAFYATWVEYGTKPHRIKFRRKGWAKALNVEGNSFANVMHLGARPQPFMRPAIDQSTVAAVTAMREYIRARLADKHGIDVRPPDDDQ